MLTLGIETSCDETAVSVVHNGSKILSNAVTSSVHLHKKFGGIIPEIASRHHLEYISYVASDALKESNADLDDIGLVSVTYGPGLIGALLVGVCFAKSISLAKGLPLVGVNHLQAHLYAALMPRDKKIFPYVGLVVSGGHTVLCFAERADRFTLIGQTMDDAAGEAFDKVAKILHLGYPGGPIIEKRASFGNPRYMRLSAFNNSSFDFSFSGIKTAVLYHVQGLLNKTKKDKITEKQINDICACFQKAVVDVLVNKAVAACKFKKTRRLVIGGGVSINKFLRNSFLEIAKQENIEVYFSQAQLCLDNAAMVAGLGYAQYKRGRRSGFNLTPVSDLGIEVN